MPSVFNKLFGSLGSNNLKQYEKIVKKINDCEPNISKLTDEELKNKTNFLPPKKF